MLIDLQPGKTLCGGRYTIMEKIGEGGFSFTYRAVQNNLNRIVCIKEYFPSVRCTRDVFNHHVMPQDKDAAVYEKYRQAFRKEAETLSTLQHPGIVEVIDIFDENNTSYMVMPFIEGDTLQQVVDRQGPLDYPKAVNYLAQVADAVAYIHERHILHRDIKPENIIITAAYHAILIDFGSAREFVNDKTQSHTSILTHGYAPPEQYSTSSRKGSYTDIYALGATFYYALTGKVPLDAVSRMTDVMADPQTLNPSIPDEANRTILKAMQLNSADRHQTMQEFMDDLRNVRPSASPVHSSKTSRKFLFWIFAFVALAALGVWVGIGIHRNNQRKALMQAEQQAALEQKIREEKEREEKEQARLKAIEDSIARVNFQTPDLKMVGAHGPIKSIVYNNTSSNGEIKVDPILSLDIIYFDKNGIITKMTRSDDYFSGKSVSINRNSDNYLTKWYFDCYDKDDCFANFEYFYNTDGYLRKISLHISDTWADCFPAWDENGMLTLIEGNGGGGITQFDYTEKINYLKFDQYSNWTKVEIISNSTVLDMPSGEFEKNNYKYIISRTIEYYE